MLSAISGAISQRSISQVVRGDAEELALFLVQNAELLVRRGRTGEGVLHFAEGLFAPDLEDEAEPKHEGDEPKVTDKRSSRGEGNDYPETGRSFPDEEERTERHAGEAGDSVAADADLDIGECGEASRHDGGKKIAAEINVAQRPHQVGRGEETETADRDDDRALAMAADEIENAVEGAEEKAEESKPDREPGAPAAFRIGQTAIEKKVLDERLRPEQASLPPSLDHGAILSREMQRRLGLQE